MFGLDYILGNEKNVILMFIWYYLATSLMLYELQN